MALQEDLISALWASQTFYASEIDALWQRHMTRAVNKLGRRRSNFRDAIRSTQKAAREFAKLTAFEDLVESMILESYVVGRMFIRERDRQIRERGKLKAGPKTIRVDKAGKSPAATITAGFDLSQADEEAVKKLSGQTNLWFRNSKGAAYFDPKAIEAINDEAVKLIADGASASSVATSLKTKAEALYGVGEFAGRGRTYWGGVAEHAATTAGVAGQMSQLVELGWSRYEVVNPMDERTTPVCQHLNGKTILVSAGVAEIEAVGNAKWPEKVQQVKPFVSGGKPDQVEKALGSKLSVGAQDMTPAQSSALADAGFATPPYHFRCRSYIDISFSPGETVPSLGPGIIPPGALKAPKTPGTAAMTPPLPKPLPKAPKPVAKPVAPPTPKPGAPPAKVQPGGFPFDIDECVMVDMRLDGANPKFVFEAPDGSRWMYKDYVMLDSPFRAHVDALAARVQTAAGVEVPQTFVIDLAESWKGWRPDLNVIARNGQNMGRPRNTSGSITRLFNPDEMAENTLKSINLEDLGPLARQDAQIDHAVNWLISNGDAHYENFILLKNGRLAGIDKAQGFKFFGKDRLAIDYVNKIQPPSPSSNGFAYMENQLQRYAKGSGPQTLDAVRDADGLLTDFGKRLKAVQDIPDEEYAATIRPYVIGTKERRAGMFGRNGEFAGKSVDDVVDAMLARKNSLVDDFDELYLTIEKKRAKALGLPMPTRGQVVIPDTPRLPSPLANHSPTRAALRQEIDDSKLRGFYVFNAPTDLQDGGMIGWKLLKKSGGAQYQFKGRLTRAMMTKLDDLARRKVSGGPVGGVDVELGYAKVRSNVIGNNAYQWVKSYNSRVDLKSGHANLGQDIGPGTSTFKRYQALMTKLDEIISGKPVTVDNIADKSLNLGTFTPTELDIENAKHLRAQLRPYFDKTAGVLKPDRWYSDGYALDLYDPTTFKPAKKPAAPKPTNTPKESFKVTAGGQNHLYFDDARVTPEGAVIQNEWGTAAARRNFESLGSYERDAVDKFNGAKAPIYEFKSTKNPDVSVRYISSKTRGEAYRGEIRVVIDIEEPTPEDFKDAWQLLRDMGVDARDEAPSLDEMKVLWAHKQAKASGAGYHRDYRDFFNDIIVADDSTPAQKLEEMVETFDMIARRTGNSRMKWDNLTDGMTTEDFLPKFTQDTTTAGRTRKPHGFPQWVRRDLTEADLEEAGVYGLYSDVTGGNSMNDLIKIMTDADNVAFVGTQHRVSQGIVWMRTMSPVRDMETGGANYVFTRARAGNHGYGRVNTDKLDRAIAEGGVSWSRNGVTTTAKFDPAVDTVDTAQGVYFNRSSMTYTDNLFYSGDRFGRVDGDDYVAQEMAQTFSEKKPGEKIRSHMLNSSSNEMIAKDSLSVQENVQFFVVSSFDERTRLIRTLRDHGLDEIGGKPVENAVIVKGRYGFSVE